MARASSMALSSLNPRTPFLTCFLRLRRRSDEGTSPNSISSSQSSGSRFRGVANAHQVSLQAKLRLVLTCELNGFQSVGTDSFQKFGQHGQLSHAARSCVPAPNHVGWHRHEVRKDSRTATMMMTEAARVLGSIEPGLSLHSKLVRFQSNETE